ncbi:hypothetical protein [Larkinella humicola]|uniref:DUF998 domain-containing protein n=1 Tax=Larkinella humicola TaxID=2607654 RepID=A0A5N1JS59_9BACT|nr:hypothetical protein [Larkinella humicola]KAA9357152.1 hypothetical protein F0P93_05300 [Larkinella humicola]
MKKHAVLLCIGISVILIITATMLYPGGSLFDKNSVGFDWTKNFISNLFAAKAINGSDNPSRIWAILGVAFHSVGSGIFFLHMSKKMTNRHAATVLKSVGIASIALDVLIVTSLHDVMVMVSSTLSLLGLFYCTVFILKSKLHVLKFACVICLLIFYYTLYLYGSGDWGLLAIMQKVSFIGSTLLVLGMEYFTKKEDFIQRKPDGQTIPTTNR